MNAEVFAWLMIYMAAVLSGIAGALLGTPTGNQRAGFWLGFLLGPVGLFSACFFERPRKDKRDEEVRAIERDEHVRMKVRKVWRQKDNSAT